MEKLNWIFIAFGVMLLFAASFSSGDISLSPSRAEASDFQLIIAIGGLVAVIVGIIKN